LVVVLDWAKAQCIRPSALDLAQHHSSWRFPLHVNGNKCSSY
jgi:hypothetical protein